MISVIKCIGLEHDLRLVILAAVFCLFGSVSVTNLVKRCLETQGPSRIGWSVLTAICLGATVWCTHFIAMLAYQSEVPVSFDPATTLLSFAAPMLLMAPALYMAGVKAHPWAPTLAGAMIGLAISGVHYLGMAAYRIDGVIEWNMGYVAFSIASCVLFSAIAMRRIAASRRKVVSPWGVAAWTLAIVLLHFTAMTAMTIIPMRLSVSPMSSEEFAVIACATAFGGLLVLVTGLVSYLIDNRTRVENYNRLLKMALTDDLTGLPNRVAYREHLDRKFELVARYPDITFAVIGMDLDRFKDVNDIHGHEAGDHVLKVVSQRCGKDLTNGEFVARLGGDEFVAIKPFRTRQALENFIERLQVAVTTPIEYNDVQFHLGVSIGVACYPQDGAAPTVLSTNADLAMYRAKESTGRDVCFYDSQMDEAIRERKEIYNDLREALKNDVLELHYQRQTCVKSGRLRGYEALLRWNHPTRGAISPGVFIPIAEENGLIVQLGEWVLRRACEEAAQWPHRTRVAVNISPLQLMQNDLPELIHRTLLETGLSPQYLEVELTESAIFEDRNRAIHLLRQIKSLGVCIALDDFGTGYSSLEILRTFPFDKIKLDRFFMNEIETSNVAKAMVRSVLTLGKSLSIPVLAEGVETRSQLMILAEEGCDEVQGFLLGRPERNVPPDPALSETMEAQAFEAGTAPLDGDRTTRRKRA